MSANFCQVHEVQIVINHHVLLMKTKLNFYLKCHCQCNEQIKKAMMV